MIETIISEVLHKLMDFEPEQAKRVKNALMVVLDEYDISRRCTEVQRIEKSWQTDLERFCERKLISGKSEATVKHYRYQISRVLQYINKPVSEITEGDLNGFIEDYKIIRHVSNSTLEGIRLCMSSFFTWLHEKGYIGKNPARGLDPIKVPKKVKKVYSDEELEKIKQCCQTVRDKAIIEFLYTTGVRVSEMTALNLDDIRTVDRTIVVYGKGAKEREVYLTDVSCMYLSMYLAERQDTNPALFVSEREPHNRLTAQGVRALLKRIGKKTGVDNVHPHRFRSTCATNLLRKGMPIEEVSQILGHEDLDTTQLYCLVDKEKVKTDHHRYMCA